MTRPLRLPPLLAATLLAACAQGGERDEVDAWVPPPRDGAVDAFVPSDAGPCTPRPETCNGADDDCDGATDEEPTDGTLHYRDADGDGFGTDLNPQSACAPPEGFVAVGGDCNDGNTLVHPEMAETCDGLDNDCVGGIDDAGCPASCTGIAFGGHGYLFCDATADWATARDACSTHGLRLVRIDSDAENRMLYEAAFAPGGIGDFWIGARVPDDGSERWRWTDGTEFWQGVLGGSAIDGLFAAWESDQPNDDTQPACGRLRELEEGRWHDTDCATEEDYVCELYP
ncbi:MAG TPA: MopE-related protein [Sandaracinaceae bacterium LLY-WYZ-13_1]|nr:MopE-related protein [Sandaracinaceae bacterium LLY-WYZ-13_1]